MPKDLRFFLDKLGDDAPEELVRISKEVDPRFELSSVMHKVQRTGAAPVQIFENVKDHGMSVVANLWGSRRLIARALDTTIENVRQTCVAAEDERRPPQLVESGPVQDVVITGDDVDLMKQLPIVTHCELDAGPFVCPGVLMMRNPANGGKINFGMYRHQVHEKNLLGVSLSPHNHGAEIFRNAEADGRDVEVVIALGHHPAMGIASQHSGGIDVSELEIMGGLLGEPVDLVRCKTVDMEVPAYAEIAIEGRLKAGVRRDDAPFGASERQLMFRVLAPGALPLMFAGIRLGAGRAVKGMINGEMLISLVGLGGLARKYGGQFDTASILAIALVVALVALVVNLGVQAADNRMTRWAD